MKKFKNISVVGLGYIGLPTAAMFASRKIRVTGVDVNSDTVDTINSGNTHIIEPDLDVAVRSAVITGYLRASLTPKPAEAFIVAVPTPFIGEEHEPDLSYIEAASKAIAPVLKSGNLVILESTSPVGATERMAEWMADARPDLTFPQTHGELSDIRIAHCPERVLPGHVMRELIENDRVVGGLTSSCSDLAVELYKIFVQGECVITDARTAEMVKLSENSFRDVNIAFANELSIICDKLNINVWELISLANRHPRVDVLKPGPGVGGHCIAVDPWFIISRTPDIARIIRTAREVNDAKPEWVVNQVVESVGRYLMANPSKTSESVKIACYGLAFKPDTDDLRESPAVEIVSALAKKHVGPIVVVEPNIRSLPEGFENCHFAESTETVVHADIHVLLVGHQAFRAIPVPTGQIIDCTGVWLERNSPNSV